LRGVDHGSRFTILKNNKFLPTRWAWYGGGARVIIVRILRLTAIIIVDYVVSEPTMAMPRVVAEHIST
jgi:hypothetical protein